MIRRFIVALVCFTSLALAAEPVYELPKVKPLTTAEALKAFDVPPGFRIELVAAEPLVRSPVAMDFDENGRLYVVELRDYNQFVNPKESAIKGCIKLLEDTDGDGVYDKATVFVDDLEAPV